MAQRQKLFTLSKENGDFEIETFRSGGKGGQHQNTTDSGVRIIHRASGATGESRSDRSQSINKKLAFRRLTSSPEFKKWLRIETARRTGQLQDIEAEVDVLMQPANIRTEIQVNGRWVTVDNADNLTADDK